MICFKRTQLIYILIPLFLMAITSCEKKSKDEAKPAIQEVITMKIKPMEKQSLQAESGTPKESSVLSESQLQTKSDIPVVSEEQLLSSSESGDKIPQKQLTFNIEKAPSKDVMTQKPPEAEPKVAKDKSDSESIADTIPKSDTLPNLAPVGGDSSSLSAVAPPGEVAPSPENLITTVDNKALLPDGEITGKISEENLFYIPKGKIDPFEPLLKEKVPVAETQSKPEEDIPERILTPLEKLDFSQMTLVAILTRESGNSVAMIQESTGKGYIINIGTYMGRNSGQVVSIEKDKLIIQEKVKDYKGNFIDHFQELKLNKLDDKG